MKVSEDHHPFLQLDEAAAPANPDAGIKRLYAKVAGFFYRDSAGVEKEIATVDALHNPQGKHAVPVVAGAMSPSAGAAACAVLATVAGASNQPDKLSLDFDAATQEHAQFQIPMPKSWNEGTVTARFRWSHAATTTNFGVTWGIRAVAISDDDTLNVNFGTEQIIADTGGTTNDLYITAECPALTIDGGPAAGDTVYFQVFRKVSDAGDTMAIDARLHSVEIFITTDADNDA